MITVPNQVKDFLKVFNKNGFQIYIVGGAVRNLLLNKEITNWDFTTNATPKQILKFFPTLTITIFMERFLFRCSGESRLAPTKINHF